MTKLTGTELIGFTVTNEKFIGRVIDYDDGVYYVSTGSEIVELKLKQIEMAYFGGTKQ